MPVTSKAKSSVGFENVTYQPGNQSRAHAARTVARVLHSGVSLRNAFEPTSIDRALVRALVYGVLRHYWSLKPCLTECLSKPLQLPKEANLEALLLVGLYQLQGMRVPEHAAVSETVAAAPLIGRKHAKGLINAVLRNALRKGLLANTRPNHPEWMSECINRDWPQQKAAILAANDAHPPMWLRVNERVQGRDEYLTMLRVSGRDADVCPYAPWALKLADPCDVQELPGFAQGAVSVQDAAAQLATPLLGVEPGMRVLDACAAPGGKTCHLLEYQPDLAQLVAVDSDANRLQRLKENLARLGLSGVTTKVCDLASNWWAGEGFHRILLDAPCSASGVIRRHPDIKVLRRSEDIDQITALQRNLLDSAWSLLSPGGILVYATCSVFRQENEQQIQAFVERTPNVTVIPMDSNRYPWGNQCSVGRQILPGEADMDGFYYACLQKD